MSKQHNKEENTENEMAEAFHANIDINQAFNNKEGDPPQSEGESLASVYLQNGTPAIDVAAEGKRESNMERELKNKD